MWPTLYINFCKEETLFIPFYNEEIKAKNSLISFKRKQKRKLILSKFLAIQNIFYLHLSIRKPTNLIAY